MKVKLVINFACYEAEWLKKILSEIFLVSSHIPRIFVYCDLRAAKIFIKEN